MSLVLQSSGGGSVTLEESVTASNFTITVPATTATMAINGPAFSAFSNATQSIAVSTNTKIQFQVEEYDTANAFDSTTNFRFTPQVAGYYQLNAQLNFAGASSVSSGNYIMFWRNGSEYKRGMQAILSVQTFAVNTLVYLNGSTDYIEVYFVQGTATSQNINSGSVITYFNGSMVRAA